MKQISGKDLTHIVERHGWSLMRIDGSHHIMESPEALYDFQFRFTQIDR